MILKHRIFAFTLLIVMVFTIGRYQIPYIQYNLFKDYIAKKLCVNREMKDNCCQGKCFLDKQIKLTNENSTTNETNNSRKVLNSEVKEFLSSHIIIPKPVEKKLSPQYFKETFIISKIAFAIFVPPKF